MNNKNLKELLRPIKQQLYKFDEKIDNDFYILGLNTCFYYQKKVILANLRKEHLELKEDHIFSVQFKKTELFLFWLSRKEFLLDSEKAVNTHLLFAARSSLAFVVQFYVEDDPRIWRHLKKSSSWIVFNSTKSTLKMKNLYPWELTCLFIFKKWLPPHTHTVCQFTISCIFVCLTIKLLGSAKKGWMPRKTAPIIYFRRGKRYLYQIVGVVKNRLIPNYVLWDENTVTQKGKLWINAVIFFFIVFSNIWHWAFLALYKHRIQYSLTFII